MSIHNELTLQVPNTLKREQKRLFQNKGPYLRIEIHDLTKVKQENPIQTMCYKPRGKKIQKTKLWYTLHCSSSWKLSSFLLLQEPATELHWWLLPRQQIRKRPILSLFPIRKLISEFLLKLFQGWSFCCYGNIIEESSLRKFFRHKSLICFKLLCRFLIFTQETVYYSLQQCTHRKTGIGRPKKLMTDSKMKFIEEKATRCRRGTPLLNKSNQKREKKMS